MPMIQDVFFSQGHELSRQHPSSSSSFCATIKFLVQTPGIQLDLMMPVLPHQLGYTKVYLSLLTTKYSLA